MVEKRSLHGGDERGLLAAEVRPSHARFGRLFALPARPDVSPTPAELGLPGGPMDGGDQHQDSPTLPAVLTYFGQFVDHDITLDLTSSLERQIDPQAIDNFRTPALELDSLYGLGPSGSPHLYDARATHAGKLLLGRCVDSEAEVDLPRNAQGVALLGDPRNDENLIVAQLHVAMLKLHNAIVDQLPQLDDGVDDESPFLKAQRLTRWHYQWLILRHYLPAIVGKAMVADVLRERKLYTPARVPFIPVEFSGAAYRFGHTMVQPGYAINDQFGGDLFPPDPGAPVEPGAQLSRDLRGGPICFAERLNWKNFIDTGVPASPAAQTRFSARIDTKLAAPLLNLPTSIVPAGVPAEQRSLAVRNLTRALRLGLPSGQDVAFEVRKVVPTTRVLTEQEIWDGTSFEDAPAPLWYYILREAAVQHEGTQLGDVGGRIVAEVLIGLLELDPLSFLARRPSWIPVVHGRSDGADFTFVDLFRVAGVDST